MTGESMGHVMAYCSSIPLPFRVHPESKSNVQVRFYVVNVILPVASIVLASASSLEVSHMGGRLGATLTLLLTAVAYKYLVAEMVARPCWDLGQQRIKKLNLEDRTH